jgi:hypothetical protein
MQLVPLQSGNPTTAKAELDRRVARARRNHAEQRARDAVGPPVHVDSP